MTIVEISKESLTINQKRSFSYRSLTFFTNFQINVGKTMQCNLFFHVISIISVVFLIYNVISISTFIGFQDTHYLVFSDILLR